MDFWKATILAQTFITVVYILFGVFVYAYYGQYATSTITQLVMTIAWQYASNALALITGYLAICTCNPLSLALGLNHKPQK